MIEHTIVHHWTGLLSNANVASLFLEFADGTLLNSLARVNQTRGNLDDNLVDWRSILFLQEQFWACGFVENSDNAHAVDWAVWGSCLEVN